MYGTSFALCLIARPQPCPQTAASRRENLSGDVMLVSNETSPLRRRRPVGRAIASLLSFVVPLAASVSGRSRLCDDCRACLCLRLQRVRRRRTRHAARAGPRRDGSSSNSGSGDQNGELRRQFACARGAQLRQGNQYPVVQCRLPIQLQSRLGRDGADTHHQPASY